MSAVLFAQDRYFAGRPAVRCETFFQTDSLLERIRQAASDCKHSLEGTIIIAWPLNDTSLLF